MCSGMGEVPRSPMVAYTSDGLSLIASKIVITMMLDYYTNTICLESWGSSSYAKALIEINASKDLCENLVCAVPKLVEEGYTKETICIEYEWEPPRCGTCLLYGHLNDDCPKATPKHVVNGMGNKGKGRVSGATKEASNDGLTIVKRNGLTYKWSFRVSKIKKVEYRLVATKNTKAFPSKDSTKEVSTSKQPSKDAKAVNTSNAFGVLSDFDEGSYFSRRT